MGFEIQIEHIISLLSPQCDRLCPPVVFICCQSLSCCSFVESDPAAAATRAQEYSDYWGLWQTVSCFSHPTTPSGLLYGDRSEGRSLPPSRPAPSLVSSSSFFPGSLWQRAAPAALSAPAAVWVEQPHCLRLGWMVALHCRSLCHWRAFCFAGEHRPHTLTQWACSQFLSIMREGVRGVPVGRGGGGEPLEFLGKSNSAGW